MKSLAEQFRFLFYQQQAGGLAQRLLNAGAISLIAKFSEVILGLLLVVILARGLGAAGVGVYAFVLALVSLLAVPVRMGLPPLVVRETARGQANHDWAPVRGLWRWTHGMALLLSLLVITGIGLVIGLGVVQDEMLRRTLLWGVWLIPLRALIGIRSAALRGLRHVLAGIVPDQIIRPALLVAFISVALLVPAFELSPASAMGLTVLSALLVFLLGAWLLYRARPASLVAVAPIYQPRVWLAAAWPLALTQGFQQINRYADVLLLGMLAATADVGIYRVAAQGASLVSLGLMALNMVTAPFITRLHAQEEQYKLQKLARRTAQAALAFALLAVAVFAVLGKWLLVTLFGSEFSAAYWPLLILAMGQLLNAGFGATGLLLNMTGHERDVTRVVAVAAGMNVLLNLALIPLFGVIGAAVATSVSLVFWNIRLWFVVRWRLGIRSSAI